MGDLLPTKGRYCPDCGGPLDFTFEPAQCPACGYQRVRWPYVGVAVVIRDEAGRVLLGRRAHGINAGKWCIPCGRLEHDEDVRAGAIRELLEETGLEVTADEIVSVQSNFHPVDALHEEARHAVGVWFAGRVVGGHLHCADGEMTELGYFDPARPPELAFPTDGLVLEQLVAERDG